MKMKKPSTEEVKKYLLRWDSLDNYVLQERSLRKLFTKTYRSNKRMDEVLIKVCSLNDFYSTHIYSPYTMAKHIVSLDVDTRLENHDLDLVNDIARVQVNEDKEINFYSFATKYCSHHKPTVYPIYDSYVEKLLWYLKKEDNFSSFKRKDFKIYPHYKNILLDFREFYSLSKFNLKQIDQYLWQAGKKYFPRNY